MTYYIQRLQQRPRLLETVSEANTRKDARYQLVEYRLSDPSADYYISTRPCKAWAES
jgi:hypothetical protein